MNYNYSDQDALADEFHSGEIVHGYMPPNGAYVDPHMAGIYGDPNHLPMQPEFLHLRSLMVDGGDRFGVSGLAFDTEELLWMGNQGGHITSYYGNTLDKYTSFQVHMTNDIRQIMPISQRGVISLTRNNLRLSIRRGLTTFDHTSPEMGEMQCLLQCSPTSVLIGGHQPSLIELDLNTVQQIRTVEVAEPGCAILRECNKFVAAGDTSGKVTLYDPRSLKSEHVLEAHSETLSDFDIHGNLILTCGFSTRLGALTADRFIMVFDMRAMRAMAPIITTLDPAFLRFIPSSTSTYEQRLAIVSQVGQFQVIDTTDQSTSGHPMYQVHTQGGALLSFDISSSSQCFAFGDTSGYLHLYGTNDSAVFNNYSEPTEFADPVDPVQPIHITDEITPYSLIPMHYPGSGMLLSDWPEYLCKKVYRKPRQIDADILRSMRLVHNVGYANNSKNYQPNQVPYKLSEEKTRSRNKSVPESPLGRGDDPFVVIPKRYRKVEVKYSKLGVEDFDFRHYNKTNFAGLETHIPNAYCNAMLQVLYFMEPLRCALLSHLCEKEFCVACELAFLFHMLDKQRGQTCQASNFLRAFRTLPEASALGLLLGDVDETVGNVNYARLIQSWQRFVLQQIHSETSHRIRPIMAEEDDSPDDTTSTLEVPSKEEVKEKDIYKEDFPPLPTLDSGTAAVEPQAASNQPKDDGRTEIGDGKQEDKKMDSDVAGKDDSFDDKRPCETVNDVISRLFSIKLVQGLTCRCGQENKRDTVTPLINLTYPDCTPPEVGKPAKQFSFARVLEMSFASEQFMQAWCKICEKYQPHIQMKKLKNLPHVLALNCQLENIREFTFWKTQQQLLKKSNESQETPEAKSKSKACKYGSKCTRASCKFSHPTDADFNPDLMDDIMTFDPNWVPLGLRMTHTGDGSISVEEIADDESMEDEEGEFFELFATVAHVKDTKSGGNLVTHIKVSEEYHQRKEKVTCTEWYLLNDFSLTPIPKLEAVDFNLDWKVPCVIYFIRRNLTKLVSYPIVNPITSDLLLSDHSLVIAKRRKALFTPLSDVEIPKEDDIVALDAEFVSLKREEAELRSDGTRSTIKPSHMSAARITCIRGQGHLRGEPFMDDYIATSEQVVDYLTEFSGIKHGDLDPTISLKYLSTLKHAYVKLRYLVDSGVIFVGHGLKKDFRVINIVVPKNQIIDTVELFSLPRQRMISLKFLAWYFLNSKIQSVTHDSREDALTALALYDKYQEMSRQGMDHVRSKIKELYDYGRKLQWKIPEVVDGQNDFAVL